MGVTQMNREAGNCCRTACICVLLKEKPFCLEVKMSPFPVFPAKKPKNVCPENILLNSWARHPLRSGLKNWVTSNMRWSHFNSRPLLMSICSQWPEEQISVSLIQLLLLLPRVPSPWHLLPTGHSLLALWLTGPLLQSQQLGSAQLRVVRGGYWNWPWGFGWRRDPTLGSHISTRVAKSI